LYFHNLPQAPHNLPQAPHNKKALTRFADEGLVYTPFAGLYPPGDIPVMIIMAMLMALIIVR
jgi:hypothetical protein